MKLTHYSRIRMLESPSAAKNVLVQAIFEVSEYALQAGHGQELYSSNRQTKCQRNSHITPRIYASYLPDSTE